MCKGREDQRHSPNGPSFCTNKRKHDEILRPLSCELCNTEAVLYCQADDAFLCQKCDRWVHSANFLAQRHVRCMLCATCHRLTQRYLVGSSVAGVVRPTVVRFSSQRRRRREDSEEVKEPFLFI